MTQYKLKEAILNSIVTDSKRVDLFYLDFNNTWNDAISKLADDYFPDKKFRFSLPPGQTIEDLKNNISLITSSDIAFKVVGEYYPFNKLSVDCKFRLNLGEMELNISARSNDQKFSTNLPLFKNSFADRLGLKSITFELDSTKIATDEVSFLNIDAELDLENTISGFNNLLELPAILPLEGPAWLRNGGSKFYGIGLFADRQVIKKKLVVPGFEVTLKDFGIIDESLYNLLKNSYSSYPFLLLNVIIKVGSVDVPMRVEIGNPDTDIHFSADLSNVVELGLGAFEKFLGIEKEPSLSTEIPTDFKKFSQDLQKAEKSLQLDEFGLYYNPSGKDVKVTSVYGGIKFDSSFDISDNLSVAITGFTFNLIFTGAVNIFELEVDGEIKVGSGYIELQAIKNGDGYELAGWLKENSEIKLFEIIELFTGKNNDLAIPDLSIDKLDFDFKKDDKGISWLFDIELKGSLPIPFNNPAFYIRRVNFSIINASANEKVQFFFGGVFTVASVDIAISAKHDATGWLFNGSTGPNQEIPFGEVIEMLWDDLVPDNGEHKLPAAISALVAKNIDVIIDTANPDGFTFKAICEISESKAFNESFEMADRDDNSPPLISTGDSLITLQNITITVERAGTIKFSAVADFLIKTFPFHVEAEYNDGWSFEADYNKNQTATTGISIVSLADAFEFAVPLLPDFLNNFTIDAASVSFQSPPPTAEETPTAEVSPPASTTKTEKHFILSGHDTTANTSIKFDLKLDITYPNGNETIFFSGHMTVNDSFAFDIIQQKNGTGKVFLAAYHQEKDNAEFDIKVILEKLGVANPPSVPLSLKDAFFVYEKNNTASFNLLVADVGAAMNLSNLPLVGKVLPAGDSISLALRVLYASDKYKWGVPGINSILPEGISKIAEPASDVGNILDLIAEIRIGEQKYYLELPISLNSKNEVTPSPSTQPAAAATTAAPPTPANTPVPVNDGITWFNIGKNFGPVVFNRIGLSYKDSLLNAYLDAGLSEGGLTFTLNGLSVSTQITKFEPKFNLNGLGLDLKRGSLEIGASFLRRQIQVTKNGKTETIDEYDGLALIGFETFSISALGSYAYYQGHPSLFIFAYLNAALGGPAFFFVEGLAAAFGYNRSLIMPSIDSVSKFPLVRQVMEGTDPTASNTDRAALLTQQLDAISMYIPPSTGEMFLAVGIKFNSFKLIDSFVLLAVSFGNHFEIDVIGQSNIIVPSEVPPGIPPLAEIKIQLLAKFLPEEGFLGVMAQLTSDSYIFSKDCHLTGGAAFYCWFKGEHQGDFVVTMGGYHSSFNVPSHYPVVPRLGVNWQVSSSLSVKGDLYFALCPHAFMAGGHLEALYDNDPLRAWFKAGADFLITWQPYHYDARLYIDIGASYTYHFFGTHHITVDLGADLHIWGPDFSGRATIHIWIIDVNVAFGSGTSSSAQPISWNDFKTKCLPSTEKIVSIEVTKGKHSEDANRIPIVNPKELTLTVNSAIPATSIVTGATTLHANNVFGISPMSVSNISSSTQTVTITKMKDGVASAMTDLSDLNFEFIKQKVPQAIWGQQFSPGLNAKDRTIELVTGLTITTKEPEEFPKAAPGLADGIDYNIKIVQAYDNTDINLHGIYQPFKTINETAQVTGTDLQNLLDELELVTIKTVSF